MTDSFDQNKMPNSCECTQLMVIKPKPKGIEFVFAVMSILFGFCYIRYVVSNTTGFFTTGLYLIIISCTVFFLKKFGCKFSKLNVFLTLAMYLFSFVFSITANDFVKFLDAVFLFLGGGYLIYSVSNGSEKIERFLPFAMVKALFEYPLNQFGKLGQVLKQFCGNNRISSDLRKIICGIIAAVPLTLIVANLLMSADAGVERILDKLFMDIATENLGKIFVQLLIGIPCGFYLFGMLYSSVHKEKRVPLNNDECEKKLDKLRYFSNMSVYAFVTPIYLLYVLYFISQANYFLSAFTGKLPDGYSYADYARKGFFELCVITVINLAVIIFINVSAKNSGRKKPAALKFYSITLCIFTLIIIATSVSKMVMYISVYGLTRLRVYTTWFMLLCALMFVLIIIKEFKFDFKMSQWVSVVFMVMFALLCFSRPDALIAKCNIEMYNAGITNDLDVYEILNMSDDAWQVLFESEMYDITDSKIQIDMLINSKNGFEKNPYKQYNISSMVVKEYLNSMKLDKSN